MLTLIDEKLYLEEFKVFIKKIKSSILNLRLGH
jgi:hypothetical protein